MFSIFADVPRVKWVVIHKGCKLTLNAGDVRLRRRKRGGMRVMEAICRFSRLLRPEVAKTFHANVVKRYRGYLKNGTNPIYLGKFSEMFKNRPFAFSAVFGFIW